MKRKLSIWLLLVVLIISGCNPRQVPGVDRSLEPDEHGYLALQWIEHIQNYLPSRLAFSNRELETAEWIVATLLEIGFDELQIKMQIFSYDDETSSWWESASNQVRIYELLGFYDELKRLDYSQNVILTIPGRSAETIIIGAHYDSVGFPGISDNAGGIVLLLESAYRMRRVDHYYTLQYIFFGAEEVGLIGSFYFAYHMSQEEIDNLILMINADVMMDGPELIYAVAYFEELPAIPSDIMRGEADRKRRGIEILQNDITAQIERIASLLNRRNRTELISMPDGVTLASDQLAFLQFGVPAMVFYSTHPIDSPELIPNAIETSEMLVGDVLHTERDCLDFLRANHPGRVERALNQFGLFLEEVISSEFVQ